MHRSLLLSSAGLGPDAGHHHEPDCAGPDAIRPGELIGAEGGRFAAENGVTSLLNGGPLEKSIILRMYEELPARHVYVHAYLRTCLGEYD